MNPSELQRLRAAVQTATEPQRLDPAVDHERVWAALVGELAPSESAEVLAPVLSNATVAFYVRTALAMLDEEGEAGDDTGAVMEESVPVLAEAPVYTPANRTGVWWSLLGAVAAIFAVTLLVQPPAPEVDVMRGTRTFEALNVVTVELVDGAGVLRWVPVPDAQVYEVSLQDQDLQLLRTLRVERPEVRVDGLKGEVVYVQVRAQVASGARIEGPVEPVPLR